MTRLLLILLLLGNFAYSQCQGDVNEDYNIDILDVVLVLNHILDNDELSDDLILIADMNGDGNIDILDIIGLVNIILYEVNPCIPDSNDICDNEYDFFTGDLIICDEDCIELENDCYMLNDLYVLSDFRECTELFNESTSLFDIGNQEWSNGRLTYLELPDNQLTSLPESIENLTSLEYLYLPDNQLTSLSESIGNLSNLQILYLHQNQLTSLPESIGNLTSLEYLHLYDNQLTSLPESICNLQLVNPLSMSGNALCEEYHYDCIGSWGEQDETNCDCNGITGGDVFDSDGDGICDDVDECISIDICDNCEGQDLEWVELWGECYNIEETTYLNPSFSQTSGQVIPPEIGTLTNLTLLHLDYNELTGEIPPEIGNLINLTDLRLNHNQLTGEIPPEIGNLTNLEDLYLYNNQLTGEIPPEIGNLTNLTYLYLRYNELTGEIPPEIANLTNLTWLGLHYNQLTGEIPPEIGNLTNLTDLYLHYNQLTGEIPPEIGSLTYLTDLYLHNNQLSGEIPSEVCDLIESNNLDINKILPGNDDLINTCDD